MLGWHILIVTGGDRSERHARSIGKRGQATHGCEVDCAQSGFTPRSTSDNVLYHTLTGPRAPCPRRPRHPRNAVPSSGRSASRTPAPRSAACSRSRCRPRARPRPAHRPRSRISCWPGGTATSAATSRSCTCATAMPTSPRICSPSWPIWCRRPRPTLTPGAIATRCTTFGCAIAATPPRPLNGSEIYPH